MKTMSSSKLTFPKPKPKQIRLTASAIQQRHVNDLKAKRHKSNAHKAALRLYGAERQKPNGMLIWQVQAIIMGKFEMCLSKATIACYTKHGIINAYPMNMGPVGHILAMGYKFLSQAYSSLIPINLMNVCAGGNLRKKMIPKLAKTFNIGTDEAMGLLNHAIRDMATDINAKKLNCAEDRRICWTTYQKIVTLV